MDAAEASVQQVLTGEPLASKQPPKQCWLFSEAFVWYWLPVLAFGEVFELYAAYINEKSQGAKDTMSALLDAFGLGSPILIIALEKVVTLGVTLTSYFLLRRYRREYYQSGHTSFWRFFSSFLYGRPIPRIATLFTFPRILPLLYFGLGINVLAFPYSYYAGFAMLASAKGRQMGPTWFIGEIPIDPVALFAAVAVTVVGARLLFEDYWLLEAQRQQSAPPIQRQVNP